MLRAGPALGGAARALARDTMCPAASGGLRHLRHIQQAMRSSIHPPAAPEPRAASRTPAEVPSLSRPGGRPPLPASGSRPAGRPLHRCRPFATCRQRQARRALRQEQWLLLRAVLRRLGAAGDQRSRRHGNQQDRRRSRVCCFVPQHGKFVCIVQALAARSRLPTFGHGRHFHQERRRRLLRRP